ncbi:hypothetical protein [Legionella pneumophila]|uniref:hypothetical protein n=1 Tax=Legionella pneumophila TaxID=446 RepID=UPI0007771720|nr:hypothetical protein [Legionella pneumophila]HAT8643603.1 hypothetical protein [Legionella pneumophila]
MSKRHESIGIKQAIHLEWMQKTTNLLLSGLDAKSIRLELHAILANQKVNGTESKRSAQSRNFAVINLMKSWVTPDPELLSFRDASLAFLQKYPDMNFAIHWGMINAVYPFWYNVAKHTGRLLALQDQVTQAQIINRLKELYGDRQSVSRYARFVIRSFISWGVLKDSKIKGCYEKSEPINVTNSELVTLMFESALHAQPDSKGTIGVLLNNPAFFPFQLPAITGNCFSQYSNRLDVTRYGLSDELLQIKNNHITIDNSSIPSSQLVQI